MAQVVLALQLPFVLVPLIKATSSKQLMGPHRNSTLLAAGAWASCGLVFVANLGLFVSELWPGAALVPHVEPDGEEGGGGGERLVGSSCAPCIHLFSACNTLPVHTHCLVHTHCRP